jgi:hypothetical protein
MTARTTGAGARRVLGIALLAGALLVAVHASAQKSVLAEEAIAAGRAIAGELGLTERLAGTELETLGRLALDERAAGRTPFLVERTGTLSRLAPRAVEGGISASSETSAVLGDPLQRPIVFLKERPQHAFAVSRDRLLNRIYLAPGTNGLRVAREIAPGLLASALDAPAVERGLATFSLTAGDVSVLSLFDLSADPATVRALKGAAGKSAWVDARVSNEITKEGVLEKLATQRNRVVLLVGHVEGQSFVVRKLGAPDVAISFAELQSIATQNHLTLVHLGCETGRAGVTGPLKPVESLDVAGQLMRALHTRDGKEFFASFGTRENPVMLEARTVEGVGQIIELRLAREARAQQVARVVTRVVLVSIPVVAVLTAPKQRPSGASTLTPLDRRSLRRPSP